jgi:hypothetical protein
MNKVVDKLVQTSGKSIDEIEHNINIYIGLPSYTLDNLFKLHHKFTSWDQIHKQVRNSLIKHGLVSENYKQDSYKVNADGKRIVKLYTDIKYLNFRAISPFMSEEQLRSILKAPKNSIEPEFLSCIRRVARNPGCALLYLRKFFTASLIKRVRRIGYIKIRYGSVFLSSKAEKILIGILLLNRS